MPYCLGEDGEHLTVNGITYEPGDDGVFEVQASQLEGTRLADIPTGVKIALCDRVFGTNNLYRRSPGCILECVASNEYRATVDTVVLPESDNLTDDVLVEFLDRTEADARERLDRLVETGPLSSYTINRSDEMVYIGYSVELPDQSIDHAQDYLWALDDSVTSSCKHGTLFVCHASEDKPFVDTLVDALDSRALNVWYDKREIVVGDSIVELVNRGLKGADFVVVVLTPHSVMKPWVKRELDSTLMRQLAREHVIILPAMVADCEVPPLLADIKYADFRSSFDTGLTALLQAIKRHSGRSR